MSGAWVVIAAYNEAPVIEQTLRGVLNVFPNVVVVDDCSRDDTARISRRVGAHVCRHPVNLGQGAALQTGICYALAKGAEQIVTFDADGQHSPDDAVRMVSTLLAGNYDVVLSSRFLGAAHDMPLIRRWVLRLAVLFTRVTANLPVTDTHNGLRVFSRPALERLRIKHNRMAHASEILEKIARLNLRWTETPGTVLYTAYSVTKGQKLSGAAEILKDLFIGKLRT